MSGARPSYDLKLDRAEKHLVDIEALTAKYVAAHPYEVLSRVEGEKRRVVHRLHFTEQPPADLALIVGDFLYNVSASLDHMMAALVPARNRNRVHFPVFWEGVWDAPLAGENNQRLEHRRLWQRYTGGVHDDALALIKVNQPPDVPGNPDRHGLGVLKHLRNADAHRELAIVGSGLKDTDLGFETPTHIGGSRPQGPDEGVLDGTDLQIPENAMNVTISGTPVVVVRTRADDDGGYVLPDAFRTVLLDGSREFIDGLRPYVRKPNH